MFMIGKNNFKNILQVLSMCIVVNLRLTNIGTTDRVRLNVPLLDKTSVRARRTKTQVIEVLGSTIYSVKKTHIASFLLPAIY